MSARNYTVTVKLKDDGTLAKLQALGGLGGSGKRPNISGLSGVNMSGNNSVFQKIEALQANQVLKLAGIGLGVGSMVTLLTKSSGQLQGIFKLWETGLTLIFRPIGDFIALALRPVTVLLLTQFITPFFRSVYPFFRDYGIKMGSFFADPSTALATLAEGIGGAVALAIASSRIGMPQTPSLPTPTPQQAQCIELCGKTLSGLPVPIASGVKDGIAQSSIIPSIVGIISAVGTSNAALIDMKTDLRTLKDTVNSNTKIPDMTTGKNLLVSLSESLSLSDSLGTDVFSGIKTDWSQAAAASAGAAAGAALAAKYMEQAGQTLGAAVARLQALASSIPNQYAWGFSQFGAPGVNTAAARTQMALMADARSV